MRKLLHAEILAERKTAEDSIRCVRHPVSVLLHNVRSLYNVGSVFRTCDSAMVSDLILCGFTPYPPRKEIEKTALGAIESVPWRYEKNIFKAIDYIKSCSIKLIAVELTDSSRQYDSLAADEFPLCLVLGNELTGIDNEVLAQCDDAIEIPMHGVKHSLNVSVAAGIAIYESVRIWKSFHNK
jgi:23S rRNA (guanosine2251-2'-O)-methyltransferase